MPSIVSRLLTPPIVARRTIARDADEWSIRLAAIAALGQYDALTVLVDGPARIRHAYNVADDPASDAAIRSAVEDTRRSGATVQTQTTVRLADDRVAETAMVAPLAANAKSGGILIALRVGRSFAAADALAASGVSELVTLDLTRDAAARRDAAHRRQAFALYELARLALFGERSLETLQDVAALLTSALDHDLVQIWLLGPDGALELCAARPQENLRRGRMHPSEHDALAEALHQHRLVRIGRGALRPWVPSETRDLIIVPLGDDARSLGVLVLGRARERYEDADTELAAVLSRFIARLVSLTIDRDNERRTNPAAAEVDSDRVSEDEPQLTGS